MFFTWRLKRRSCYASLTSNTYQTTNNVSTGPEFLLYFYKSILYARLKETLIRVLLISLKLFINAISRVTEYSCRCQHISFSWKEDNANNTMTKISNKHITKNQYFIRNKDNGVAYFCVSAFLWEKGSVFRFKLFFFLEAKCLKKMTYVVSPLQLIHKLHLPCHTIKSHVKAQA
jgi:hypothetical protein